MNKFIKSTTKNYRLKTEKGFAALLSVVLITAVGLVIASAIEISTVNSQKTVSNSIKASQAYYVAEAGIEDTVYRVAKNKKYEASNVLAIGNDSTETTIASNGSQKTIESKSQALGATKKVQAIITTDSDIVSFHYGIQVDNGGLELSNNATINGSVYSNGSIKGANNSQIIGDAYVAGGTSAEPDQQSITQSSNFPFGIKNGSIYYLDSAQSFSISETNTAYKASFYLKKNGSPPDQTVKILTDNNGKPSRTAVATGTLKSSKATTNYSWVDVSFDSPPILTAGQTYWLMVDVSQDNNNYWTWGKDSSDSYLSGTGKYTNNWNDSGAVWSLAGGDLNFKIWLGSGITTLENIKVSGNAYANTIKNSNISKNAYYQSIENTTVTGTKYPGSSDQPPTDLPISYAQIQEWETAAQNGGIINGNYNLSGNSTDALGPVKIIGNMTISGNAVLTINGPIWVTGNISFSNNSIIKMPANLPNGFPVVADNPSDQTTYGKINMNGNTLLQDSSGGGCFMFISTNKLVDAGNSAVSLSNNLNYLEAQAIIYATQGAINISNNAKIKELTGYKIYVSNNAQVDYDQGLINANFSTGPTAGWKVTEWKEVE